MQAVIQIGSSQYLVQPGTEIRSSRPQVDRILLLISDQHVSLGQPDLPQAQVSFENVGQIKGPKITTVKYKAKSRYRRVRGFRPLLYRLKILDIREK